MLWAGEHQQFNVIQGVVPSPRLLWNQIHALSDIPPVIYCRYFFISRTLALLWHASEWPTPVLVAGSHSLGVII